MDCKLVRTQAEFDEAIKAGFCAEVTEGEFSASGAASVYARGSASVRASGSASVRASDSVTVHAWDSAIVHAFDSATVHARDLATVRASTYVAVTIAATFKGQISGGRQIRIPKLKTIKEWCAFYVHEMDRARVSEYSEQVDTHNLLCTGAKGGGCERTIR